MNREAHVGKGWVRDGVLSTLSKEPATLTEVARKLGVSKSTASYHLALLLQRGVIEEVDSGVARGGVASRRFALRGGSVVVFPTQAQEESELRKLREAFDLQLLALQGSASATNVVGLQVLLYKMYVHMFKITRSEHRRLMIEYGSRAGGALAKHVGGPPSGQAMPSIASFLRESGIGDVDLVGIPGSTVSVLVSSACIGSDYHAGNSCYFLEGFLGGLVAAKMGAQVKVGRLEVPGLSSCCLAVGRVKRLDLGWLSEALLSSPRYSAIYRGRRGG